MFSRFDDARKRTFVEVADSMREDKPAAKNERIAGLVAEIEMAKQRGRQEGEADKAVTFSI